MKDIKLLDCPYCGRPAEVFIGSEMSDTSKVHKVRCSYMYCFTIEQALSGWSPNYKEELNNIQEDWNASVEAILKRRTQKCKQN